MTKLSSQLVPRLLEELNSPAPAVRREAAKTLGNIGERSAIPALIDRLADGDPDVEEAAIESLSKIRGREVAVRLIPMLAIEHVVMRNRAIQLLRVVGADAPEIIVRLLEDGDRDQRIFCADILGSINIGGAVKALISALHDSDANVRATAADSLGKLRATVAVKPLLKQLHDDEWVQYSVVQSLANIGDRSAIDPLLEHLDRATEFVQVRIIEALGEMGDASIVQPLLDRIPDAHGMLLTALCVALVKTAPAEVLSSLSPDLKEKLDTGLWDSLGNPSEDIQEMALKGLATIADTSSVYNILELARNTDSPRLTERAYDTLESIGAVAPLLGASASKDSKLANVAVTVLSRLDGPEPHSALIKALDHPSGEVRSKAVAGLGKRKDISVNEKLAKMLADEDPNVILEAAKALGQMRLEQNLPLLNSLLCSEHKAIRRQAMRSMLEIGGPTLPALFSEGLRHPDSNHRRMAARAIGAMASPETSHLLRGLLLDEDAGVRRVAVWAMLQTDRGGSLEHMEPILSDPSMSVRRALINALTDTGNEQASGILIKFLNDPDKELRLYAMRSLGLTAADEAVIPLIEMLNLDDDDTKVTAAKALGRIKDQRAVPALLGLLSDSNPEVRAVTDNAIQAIEGRL